MTMIQHFVFQTVAFYVVAGLSLGPRELIKNGPDSDGIIGKDNNVVAFESNPVEPSKLTPVESVPRKMFHKDIGRRLVENSQVGTFDMYSADGFDTDGTMIIKFTYGRQMKDRDDKIKDVNALTSGEVTRKGILREQANRNSKEIQDIQDDHDPLDQWYFNINVRIFNGISTYLFGNFSSNHFLIFLMSVLIIIAFVGIYVLCT